MEENLKQLLLKDLSVRLLYGVKFTTTDIKGTWTLNSITSFKDKDNGDIVYCVNVIHRIDLVKPYLRPMSSMTKEERIEFSRLLDIRYCEEDWEGHISTSYCIEIDSVYTDDEDGIKYPSPFSMEAIDWLNKYHFDYRGLIEKGLALEAPKGMYTEE